MPTKCTPSAHPSLWHDLIVKLSFTLEEFRTKSSRSSRRRASLRKIITSLVRRALRRAEKAQHLKALYISITLFGPLVTKRFHEVVWRRWCLKSLQELIALETARPWSPEKFCAQLSASWQSWAPDEAVHAHAKRLFSCGLKKGFKFEPKIVPVPLG